MAFRFNAIDPSTGYEQWFDPTTGAYQLRPPANDPAPTTVTTTQSQSTSQQTAPGPIKYNALTTSVVGDITVKLPDSSGVSATAPSNTQPAAAAAGDDNFGLANTVSGANALLNAGTSPGSLVQPQPNILDSYASYTYNLGWYLLTPSQYASLPKTPKIDINGWSLLAQSGGAGIQQQAATQQGVGIGQNGAINGPTATLSTPNRNKYFMLDYYLDDFEMTTQITGTGPSQNSEFSFKVTEPNGLTLLTNLNNAVRDFYQDSDTAPLKAFYCMVIKFYGWDIHGNLITDPTSTTGSNNVTPGISNAVITRYYPFIINDFTFKYAGKGVEYEIKCFPANIQYGKSSATASLPYNIELTGKTVNDVLAGNGATTAAGNNSGSGREASNTPAPINISVNVGGVTTGSPGAPTQNQADIINLLAAGNMGA